jgi:hypothetical protein
MAGTRPRTAESAARARMVGLALWGRSPAADPKSVVERLVAMQAQEHAYARWSVGQRCDVPASVVDAAFDAGELIRTHVLRPTWHYASPADLRWLLALTGRRLDAVNARRYDELDLDARTLRRATDVIADAVAAGPRTRRELADRLQRRRISPGGQRMPHLLFHAELHMVVCSGPMRGKEHTYAPFDDRVPAGPSFTEEEALAELARRWFTTRGPASLVDFRWWSGLPAAQARAALGAVAPELSSYEQEDRTYWFAESPRPPKGPRVDLVQCYDETIISYTETRDVLATTDVSFPAPRSIDGFTHVLLCDGRLAGHWRVHRRRGDVKVETRLARTFDERERAALDAAVARYEEFVRT